MPQPVSGPLLHVLGHAAIYDVNLAYQRSSFHQSAGSAFRAAASQQSLNISGGLNLPLHESGKSHSLLGQLSLGGHINAQRTTASAWVTGYDSNASWSPVDGLQFDINRNVIGSPGGSASVLSIQTDVLVFDPRTHQDVRVTQLSGSNPDLRSSTTSTDLRATYMHRPSDTSVAGGRLQCHQDQQSVLDPTLSDIAESAFPDHFLRDASGQLVQVDTRPVNALRQSDSRLSLNLHLSGGRGRPARGRTPPPPSSSFKPLIWNLFMSSSWKMRSEFQLTPTGPTYDLNNASIGTSGGGSRRTTMIMGSMMRGVSGLRMSINWNGSGRLLGQGGADGIYRQPLKINMAAFTTVLQGKAPQSGLNLTLAVDNLLNRRPMVSFPDRATPFSQLPANLDPLGRVIKLSLRATLP
jgi:outer membrane receptor protein involved in Fe transport